MYYLSEKTNLGNYDKALNAHTSKYGKFEHRMLSSGEIKISAKKRFTNN